MNFFYKIRIEQQIPVLFSESKYENLFSMVMKNDEPRISKLRQKWRYSPNLRNFAKNEGISRKKCIKSSESLQHKNHHVA